MSRLTFTQFRWEGFFDVPLEHLTAVPLLASQLKDRTTEDSVILAPDLGAVKLAKRYSELLTRPIALAHKIRLSGEEMRVRGIVGDVAGRKPIIVDDMISTGRMIEAAARAALTAGCRPEITVVATHALLVGPAVGRLSGLPIKRMIVTNSVPTPNYATLPLSVATLAPIFGEAVRRMSVGQSMAELLAHR